MSSVALEGVFQTEINTPDDVIMGLLLLAPKLPAVIKERENNILTLVKLESINIWHFSNMTNHLFLMF